jgi:hypothetical protein
MILVATFTPFIGRAFRNEGSATASPVVNRKADTRRKNRSWRKDRRYQRVARGCWKRWNFCRSSENFGNNRAKNWMSLNSRGDAIWTFGVSSEFSQE